jgi:hypothetical protein
MECMCVYLCVYVVHEEYIDMYVYVLFSMLVLLCIKMYVMKKMIFKSDVKRSIMCIKYLICL